ncbi:MAG TPA: hypothetical protein VGA94_04930, partial [Thermodesulfobacteriota bacterium]
VLPIFVNLGEKEQEIEIELGVTLPEMRRKIIDIVKSPAKLLYLEKEPKPSKPSSSQRKGLQGKKIKNQKKR